MTYQLKYYNSIDRSWRDGKTFTSKPKAAIFARDYFASIRREGIFGEADKLYLVGVRHTYVYKVERGAWKKVD